MDYRLWTKDLKIYALKAKNPTSASGCKDRKIDEPVGSIFSIFITILTFRNIICYSLIIAEFLYLPVAETN